ncbi:MAG: S41 family peptidase [Bacteroidota bacterium]|nr:S41 family peptidase [Bacteroidota bacterium]
MSERKLPAHIIRLPFIIAIALAGGIFIGAKMFSNQTHSGDVSKSAGKFRDILNYINSEYVDTVNVDVLAEEAINRMLEKLDPHSVYIPPKDMDMAKAQLEGDFEGIGIEFQVLKDTLYVVSPISGGPSEAVGLQAGDKILKVDDKNVASIKLTTQDVFKYLRGKKGTKVKVSILRKGNKGLLDFTIVRDKIPTFSVDVAFMVDKEVAYIKVNRFSANTYNEFKKAISDLKAKGMKKLMLDLRGNPGGYMDKATQMADELLDGNKLIVFTKGKQPRYNQETRAYISGDFEKGPVIVLIDEGSASASEIVSGALQDNDRALIVGRRSFGKGLVQMPIPLGDNSELRITISRYYTPSGRSIQKPYDKEHTDDYNLDLYNRYKKGEFFSADSIKFDKKLQYKTTKGRMVFGGGGIMPDIFIPRDTSMYTTYFVDLLNKGVIREFTLDYSLNNKKELEEMGFEKFKSSFVISQNMIDDIIKLGEKNEVKFKKAEFEKSKEFMTNQLKAYIARGIWKNEGFYPIYLEKDEMYSKALKLFPNAEKIEKGKF